MLTPLDGLRRLTLGKKLLTAFGLLFFLLTLSLVAILFHLNRINSYVERHNRITVPAVVTAADLREQVYRADALLRQHLKGRPGESRAVTLAEIRRIQAIMLANLELYRDVHAAKTHPILHDMLMRHDQAALVSEEDAILTDIAARVGRLGQVWNTIVLSEPPRPKDPLTLLDNATRQSSQLTDAVSHLMRLHSRIDQEMKIEGDVLLRQASFVILALVALLGVVLAGTYRLVTTEIIQPLRRLAGTADRVAHQDLGAEFDLWPSRDEVGALSRSLRSMLTTLRERTRSLERKTGELESFTSSVAHDLKAPVREIEGFASLLKRRVEDTSTAPATSDPTAAHYLERIHQSSLRMASLIDALLRYSRLEQQSLPKTRVNIVHLVEDVVRPYAGPSGKEARPAIVVDLPFNEIHGEPASVRQALANLLDNAIKFSGGLAVADIVIGGHMVGGERVVWVRDRGIGFDPTDSERIFGLFERLATPQAYEGTGVGLAIVKLIMEKHAGRVWVESSLGKGSTFYLAFPDEIGREG